MRKINEIIVHATATQPKWMAGKGAAAKRDEIRRWHVEDRGWSDIGYHMIIDRDGTRARGRAEDRVGAHVRGRNTNSLGVSLVGGYGGAETDAFSDHFTPEQDDALRELIAEWTKVYPKITQVSGHNEYAAKACPCFNVRAWQVQKPKAAPAKVHWIVALLRALFGGKT
tara:strand:+ start:3107 stop:3613 length:507 start_codon:yes stop_codon:yes gene_type:complete